MRLSFFIFFCLFFFTSSALADSYQLNSKASQIDFQFYHLPQTRKTAKEKIKGTFTNFEVDIALGSSQEIEFLNIKIDTTSIASQYKNTDLLVKENFFDTQKYEKITLESKKVENLSAVSWVTCELNIKDNVRKVILKLNKKKIASTRSFENAYIFSGKLLLNPEDFDLTENTTQTIGKKNIGEENTHQITSENLLELFFKIEVFRPF